MYQCRSDGWLLRFDESFYHPSHRQLSFHPATLEQAIATPTNDFAFLDCQERLHVIFPTHTTPRIAMTGQAERFAGQGHGHIL